MKSSKLKLTSLTLLLREREREGDDKDNEDKCSPLDVSVSKKNGTSLNFRCSACYGTGDITVLSISLKKNLESSEDEGVLHDCTFNENQCISSILLLLK